MLITSYCESPTCRSIFIVANMTTEHCTSKNDARKVPRALKNNAKGSLTSVYMWQIGSEKMFYEEENTDCDAHTC